MIHLREALQSMPLLAARSIPEPQFPDAEELATRDGLLAETASICVEHQEGSTSLLQRRLKIGYGRAAKLIDQLHFAGILAAPHGAEPRKVLIPKAHIEEYLSLRESICRLLMLRQLADGQT
jgi:Ftsk gamma domain